MTWSQNMFPSIFLVLLPLGLVIPQDLLVTPSLEAFSGVYTQEVATSSIFYTSVAPLIYGFKVPNWTEDEAILNCTTFFPQPENITIDPHPHCIGHSMKDCNENMACDWHQGVCMAVLWQIPFNSSIPCSTPFQLNLAKIESRFSEYLFNNRPLLHRLTEMGASPQVTEILFDCHKLGPHFPDIYVDEGVMQRYLEKLKGCSPAGDMEYFRHLNNFAYNISAVYRETIPVWPPYHALTTVNFNQIAANTQIALGSLQFLNYAVELNRWHLAISDCEAGRIPGSLVTPELIGDSLQELFEILSKTNLQPVISASDVGNYFKNHLTDCTFSNGSLIVRVLVPLIEKGTSYSLISIHPAMFYDPTFGRLCQTQLSSDVFLFDNLSRVAYTTSCTQEEFCHVPSYQSSARADSCASAVLNEDWEDALQFCPQSCYSLTKYHKRALEDNQTPSVMQTTPTTWLITGSALGSRISVSCPTPQGQRSTKFTVMKAGMNKGALEIGVPCGCFLTVGTGFSAKNYTGIPLCVGVGPKTAQFKQIVPFNWIRKPNVALSKLSGSSGSSYFPISEDDVILGGGKESQENRSNGVGAGTLFLIVSCVLITLAVGALIGIVAQRRNLSCANLVKRIPGPVTYQDMGQDQDL